jgi:hypothetical protein
MNKTSLFAGRFKALSRSEACNVEIPDRTDRIEQSQSKNLQTSEKRKETLKKNFFFQQCSQQCSHPRKTETKDLVPTHCPAASAPGGSDECHLPWHRLLPDHRPIPPEIEPLSARCLPGAVAKLGPLLRSRLGRCFVSVACRIPRWHATHCAPKTSVKSKKGLVVIIPFLVFPHNIKISKYMFV